MKRKLNENKEIVGEDGFVFLQVGINRYVATNESIAEYISKKVNSEIELYHDSGKYKSKYYFLKNIFKEDGGYVQMRVSDHDIMSRRVGLGATGGADIDWSTPIYKDSDKDILDEYDKEELDEWIDDWILYSIEDGMYYRKKTYKKGGNVETNIENNSFVTYRLKNQKGKGYSGLYKKLFNLLNKDSIFSECYDEYSYYDGNDMIVKCTWGLEGELPKGITEEDNFKKGGNVTTWKDKYNKKYGYDKGTSHSLKEISKDTGVSLKGIQQIYNKGIGAYKTNPESVRPSVNSAEQWAYGRVYSSVMGGNASKIDKNELKMEKGGKVYNAHILTDDNKMIHRRYPKKVTHNEIYNEYKDKGVEIKDSQIHFAKPIDFYDTLRQETKKYVRENMNDDVDSKSIFISSIQKGNEYIATEIKGDTISGKAFTITPKDLFEITMKNNTKRKYAKGGEITEFTTLKELNAYKKLSSKRKIKKITNPFKGVILIDNDEQIEYFFEEVSPNKYKFSFEEEFDEFFLEKGGSTYSNYKELTDEQIIKKELDRLGLNERTEYVDVETEKRGNFRLYRTRVLDDKKHPKRKYYSDDKGDVYVIQKENPFNLEIEKEILYKIDYDDNIKEILRPFWMSKTKLNYGKFKKSGSTYQRRGDIKTWKEGDEVMVLMRGTKASGYQKAIITSIDKENGILTQTDNPETLLSVYSKEEKLSDEIYAKEIKGFKGKSGSTYQRGGEIKNYFKKNLEIVKSDKPDIFGEDYYVIRDKKDKSHYVEGGYWYIVQNLKERGFTSNKEVSDMIKNAKEVSGIETYAKGGEVTEVNEDGSNLPKPLYDMFSEMDLDRLGDYSYMEELREKAKEMGYGFDYDLSGGVTEFWEIKKMAKGGSLESHALAIGDEILGFNMGEAYVINKGVVYMVDLAKGKRKITKMTREDAISTFEKGGMTNNFDSDFMDLVKG